MRRTNRTWSRKGVSLVDPFTERTERAFCYEVSPYQALCWRERFDGLTQEEKRGLAGVPIHGFVTVFGAELTHRLSADTVRQVTPTPQHARLRAHAHSLIRIPDQARQRCIHNPVLSAQIACKIMLDIRYELGNLAKIPDRERQAQEKQAAKDLGLNMKDPARNVNPVPKVKAEPSTGDTMPGAIGAEPIHDGDTVQTGAVESTGEGQEVASDDTGPSAYPAPPDGLTWEDVNDAAQADAEYEANIDSLKKSEDYLKERVRTTCENSVPQTILNAWKLGGTGEGGGKGECTPSLTLAAIMTKHPEIKRVLGLAGRLVPILDRLSDDKKARQGAGRSRIENTTEIHRLTMHEKAGLAGVRGGIVAADTYRRVLEGSALGYQGEDPRGEGAIVICLDQSGSMFQLTGYDANDVPIQLKQEWAQAVALALLVRASRTGRKVAIVPYDGYVQPHLVQAFPRKMTVDQAVNALECGSRCGGGTDWRSGLTASLDLIKHCQGQHLGRADIIHVTDGEPDLPTGFEAIRSRAKAMNVRIHGIAVGNKAQAMAGDANSPLALWSDTICAVTDTTCDSAAVQALGRI